MGSSLYGHLDSAQCLPAAFRARLHAMQPALAVGTVSLDRVQAAIQGRIGPEEKDYQWAEAVQREWRDYEATLRRRG
jgi:hypothetical protein